MPMSNFMSISSAVTEYIWICLIILFYVSQINDYKRIMVSLMVTQYDTIPREDLPSYYPAFMTAAFDNAPFAPLRPRKQSQWQPPSALSSHKTSHHCLSSHCLRQ
ncbi:hypothetical protein KIN20_020950 [Parelaphostrongylus tenuis]|uniref:Uncharacterized protein n=1 Tax=Parelaphostrongylus tenuis TaxID=148309 RepID=A0AAD5MNH2_PARTN|nr:hypothetical protein KIN20_020950 [Parelaphostrongylus tenuis]